MALLQISEPGKTKDPHDKKYFVGIDLGTTNSLISLVQNGSPTILKDQNDNELIPSVVNYTKENISIGLIAWHVLYLPPVKETSSSDKEYVVQFPQILDYVDLKNVQLF